MSLRPVSSPFISISCLSIPGNSSKTSYFISPSSCLPALPSVWVAISLLQVRPLSVCRMYVQPMSTTTSVLHFSYSTLKYMQQSIGCLITFHNAMLKQKFIFLCTVIMTTSIFSIHEAFQILYIASWMYSE